MAQFGGEHAFGELFLELPNQAGFAEQALGILARDLGQ